MDIIGSTKSVQASESESPLSNQNSRSRRSVSELVAFVLFCHTNSLNLCSRCRANLKWCGTRYKFTFLYLENNKTFLIENLHLFLW